MKNSMQSGIGTAVRRSVSILAIFAGLALTNVAKAADFKGTPSDAGTSISVTNSTVPTPPSSASQANAETPRLEASLHSFSENRQLYCYTDFGVTPIYTFAVPGDSCYAYLTVWPYSIVYGVVGF